MKSIWVAGVGALMVGVAGCANTSLNNLEKTVAGANFDPPPNGLASLYIYRDSDGGSAAMATAWVDGQTVGNLGPHAWSTIGIPPGAHQVGCSNGNQIGLTIAQGEIRFVEFVVRNDGSCTVFETPNDRGRAGVGHGKRA